jgi:hypothetical protein
MLVFLLLFYTLMLRYFYMNIIPHMHAILKICAHFAAYKFEFMRIHWAFLFQNTKVPIFCWRYVFTGIKSQLFAYSGLFFICTVHVVYF